MTEPTPPRLGWKELTERERRIIETKRRVNEELARERAERARAELWNWYREEGVEQSFKALAEARELRRRAELSQEINEALEETDSQ